MRYLRILFGLGALLGFSTAAVASDGQEWTSPTQDGNYCFLYKTISESAKTIEVTGIQYKSKALSVAFDGGEVVLKNQMKNSVGTLYTVVSIAAGAFQGGNSGGNAVTAFDLTDCTSLTTIPASAFQSCNTVLAIGLPTTITSIGNYAFKGCSALKQVTCSSYNSAGTTTYYNLLPTGITSIGEGAFDNCIALTNIYLPQTLRTLGKRAFAVTTNMATVRTNVEGAMFPSALTTIGEQAFINSGITSVTLQDNITSIGQDAFARCGSLTSVRMGGSGVAMPYGLFSYCGNLVSVDFRKTPSIGDYAFYQCYKLESIHLYNQVATSEFLTTIGYGAFYSCTSLKSIVFPSTLTSVLNYAFADCDALRKVDATKVHDPSIFNGASGAGSFPSATQRENIRLYVSFGDEEAYHTSNAFSAFTHLIADCPSNTMDEVIAGGLVGYHYRLFNDIAFFSSKYSSGGTVFVSDEPTTTTSGPAEGETGYYNGIGQLSPKGYNYDRSTWVAFTNVGDFTDANIAVGRTFELTDKLNPTFAFESGFDLFDGTYEPITDVAKGNFSFDYEPNVYCPANFTTQADYTFIEPQPNELATVKWAVYAGDGKFYLPAKQVSSAGYINQGNLTGGFAIDTRLNSSLSFTPGYAYSMTAVLQRIPDAVGGAPRRAISYDEAGLSTSWQVLPTEILSTIEGDVNTGIDSVSTADVVGTLYFNAAGVPSGTPWKGVNIVVTTHGDNTVTTTKQLFK